MRQLGERLRSWRKEQGLSIRKLALRAGLYPRTLSLLEQGANAKMGTWLKVLGALGKRPEELFAGLPMPQGLKPSARESEAGQQIKWYLGAIGGRFSGTVPQLARRLGLSERTTWRGLAELQKLGEIIKVEKGRGRGRGNTYVLVRWLNGG